MNLATVSDAPTDEMETGEVSALEAARRLGVQLNYLYGLLRLGRLSGRKELGEWRVGVRGIEERLQRRQRIMA